MPPLCKTKKVSDAVAKAPKRKSDEKQESMKSPPRKSLRGRDDSINMSSASMFDFNFGSKRSKGSQDNSKIMGKHASSNISITSSKSSTSAKSKTSPQKKVSKSDKSDNQQISTTAKERNRMGQIQSRQNAKGKISVANTKKNSSSPVKIIPEYSSSENEDDSVSTKKKSSSSLKSESEDSAKKLVVNTKENSSSSVEKRKLIFSSSESENEDTDDSVSTKKKSLSPLKSQGSHSTKKLVTQTKKSSSSSVKNTPVFSSSESENENANDSVSSKKKSPPLKSQSKGSQSTKILGANKTIPASKRSNFELENDPVSSPVISKRKSSSPLKSESTQGKGTLQEAGNTTSASNSQSIVPSKKKSSPVKNTPVFSSLESENEDSDDSVSTKKKSLSPLKSQGSQSTKTLVTNTKKSTSSSVKNTPVFSSSESENENVNDNVSPPKKSSPLKSHPGGSQSTKILGASNTKPASKRSSFELENNPVHSPVISKRISLSPLKRESTQGEGTLQEAGNTTSTSNSQSIVPSGTNGGVENTVLAVLVTGNYDEYRRLQNACTQPYIRVPLSSSCMNYSYPTDYTWVDTHPGVLMTVIFDVETVKTGYIRIAERTTKPFERTTTGQICLAVVEGEITVKSTSFDFNEKGEPVLQSVSLFIGCHITIPNNSMYTLENLTDEECCIYYCHVRT